MCVEVCGKRTIKNMFDYGLDRKSKTKTGKKSLNDKTWIRNESTKKICASKFSQFCKRTDLHGYKYIVMEDLNVIERSCWALAVILSIIFAAYLVVTAYRWYARNPIVTVIESTQGAIWDVPFPAVTICNLNLISRKAARAFADEILLPENISADFVYETLRLVPLLQTTYATDDEQKQNLQKLQVALELNNITIEALIRKLSPASSCTHLVQRCMWKNTIFRCDQLFQQVFTMLNICCTFNYYAVEHKDESKNREKGLFHLPNPRRVASSGYQTALTVLLNTDLDDYYSTSVASQGALVFIDNAYNVPNLDSPVRMVNPSSEVLIALSPERTYTTSGVKSFSPEERQCYYYDEIKLAEFRQYSFHNCIAFKNVQIIMNSCGCVPFYFPIKDRPRTCNFTDLTCLENVFNKDYASFIDFDSISPKCLPACEHYDYPLEVALGNLTTNIQVSGLPFFNDVNLENCSLLNVFFNDLVSTRYRRDVYLNWQNILAAFGGLLSLMLGFTLISGFDLLLFFTLRIIYDSFINVFTDNKVQPGKTIKVRELYMNDSHNKKITTKQEISNGKKIKKWQTDICYNNTRY